MSENATMTSEPRKGTVAASDRELVLTRHFDAPRELVWKVWTEPKHMEAWFGPRGFSTRVKKLDLRPGGVSSYVMVGPDGKEYPGSGVFKEIVPLQKIVSTDGFGDDFPEGMDVPQGEMVVTTTFEDEGTGTKLTIRIMHASVEDRRKHEAMGVGEGWHSSLDCLDEHLAAMGAENTSDREIMFTRLFDAPRELVWKVWTDASHLAKWWGPTGFRTTTERQELRPGGTWRFVMHGPDGHDYQNEITYQEVQEPERLVYKHGGGKDTEPVNFQVFISFDAAGNDGSKTRLVMRSVFPSKAAKDFVTSTYGAIEGGRQTLGRLREYLEAVRTGEKTSGRSAGSDAPRSRTFVMSRVFRAPREKVYEAWTTREHLKNWFGPRGCVISECTLDLRPGGVFHYCMKFPAKDGQPAGEMWGRWLFREIVPPERLEFVVSFSDRSGKVTRAPFEEKWPLEMVSTVTFEPHAGIGRGTVVTLRWEGVGTDEERAVFDAGFDSMREGWGGTFDSLEEYLGRAGLAGA